MRHRRRGERGYSLSTRAVHAICLTGALAAAGIVTAAKGKEAPPSPSPFFDYRQERPGASHKITPADLPSPDAAESVDNGPRLIPRPARAWPAAPPGFRVDLYADGLQNPRLIRTAPNGDVLVAESDPGRIRLLRGVGKDGRALENHVFASGLHQHFGIALYPAGSDPRWIYVGNTDSVVRFPYASGDLLARGRAETVTDDIPGGGRLRGG